jgi:hypothetical protein
LESIMFYAVAKDLHPAQMARLERVLPVLRERVGVRDPIGTWVLKFAEDGHFSHAAAVKHGMTVTKRSRKRAPKSAPVASVPPVPVAVAKDWRNPPEAPVSN